MPDTNTTPLRDIMSEHELIILQDHERRITTLEVTMSTLSSKMDVVDGKVDGIKSTIDEGNKKQESMLDTIHSRMLDEYFRKKEINLSNKWKVVFTLLGGGSFLYMVFDTIVKLTQ